MAAWLCRRYTEAPLRELAVRLGLSRADSVPNLTRRIEARLATFARLAEDLERIMRRVTGRAEVLVDQSQTPEGPVAIPKPEGEATNQV